MKQTNSNLENLTGMVISDYYKGLGHGIKKMFRNLMCARLQISEPTFTKRIRRNDWKAIEEKEALSVIEEFKEKLMQIDDVKQG